VAGIVNECKEKPRRFKEVFSGVKGRFSECKERLSEFKGIQSERKEALSGKPQLLEKLGVLARTSKTAARRSQESLRHTFREESKMKRGDPSGRLQN